MIFKKAQEVSDYIKSSYDFTSNDIVTKIKLGEDTLQDIQLGADYEEPIISSLTVYENDTIATVDSEWFWDEHILEEYNINDLIGIDIEIKH